MNWFEISSVREKMARIDAAIEDAFRLTKHDDAPDFVLSRDVRVVAPAALPPKPGLSHASGQARLLHDLASIELQAMELAMRSLFEYPDAPKSFREELAELALGESRHLRLCLDGIEALGHVWGDWDVHSALWNTVDPSDSLLDRILIVHRYLEGAGLDAGESILKRLMGVGDSAARQVVSIIVREEVDHVLFGTRWYREIARRQGIDAQTDFVDRIGKIARLAPRRERLARRLRAQAGFTDIEMDALEIALKTSQ